MRTGSTAGSRISERHRARSLPSMHIAHRDRADGFTTADGSTIRELFGPVSTPAANQSLAEATLAPGQATVRHHHRVTEEIYHLTAGTGVMELDGVTRDVGPGDTILIPPGAWHQITNTGDGELRLLCCCAPPYSHEDTFFDEVPRSAVRESIMGPGADAPDDAQTL